MSRASVSRHRAQDYPSATVYDGLSRLADMNSETIETKTHSAIAQIASRAKACWFRIKRVSRHRLVFFPRVFVEPTAGDGGASFPSCNARPRCHWPKSP